MKRVFKKISLFIFSLIVFCATGFGQTTFIEFNSSWDYFDNESEPANDTSGNSWKDFAYNTSDVTGWSNGPAELGYGDGDEETTVNDLTEVLYVRQSFNVTNPTIYDFLKINLIFDDGAVVYLNGIEVQRVNMPTGTVSYSTLATKSLDNELAYAAISNSLLTGTNVIAVEIHQESLGSSDISFNLELTETETRIISFNSSWDYFDNSDEPILANYNEPDNDSSGDNWTDITYSTTEATGWQTGDAELGYGDGDETTIININELSIEDKTKTAYFRHSFNVPDPAIYDYLKLNLIFDDGAVVYLNGNEVMRVNMPTGTVSYSTFASTTSIDNESAFTIISNSLLTGPNVIAAEVHQADIDPPSTDISFNFEMAAETDLVTRGPYLQKGTPSSIVVKWRTALDAESNLEYDTDMNFSTPVPVSGNSLDMLNHEAEITGLLPDTKYYYRLKNGTSVILEDTANNELFFTTHPTGGTVQPYRFWVLGDPGTGGDYNNGAFNRDAEDVRDAYYNYLGSSDTDGILFLGDNAYPNGTDAEYQRAIFEIYDDKLKNTIAWSCIGNHDAQFNENVYLDIFTFPTNGESGGMSSSTESYYSFDYGNIHFIVLDSFGTDRSVNEVMYNWAENDIQNTTQQWIVAFWHHPPYSKGSHDSDAESELIQMRENFLPMLEANGVDLVLGGHSHSYERSKFINGHYGLSGTFDPTNHIVGPNGSGDGNTIPYGKSLIGTDAGKGAVYVVTGSAGKTSTGDLDHQAMYVSLEELGSSVLEVDGNNLTLKFLRNTGAIEDEFTITKADYDYVHVNSGWSPSIPPTSGSHDIVVRAGNPTISSSSSWDSVTVNAGAGLTIGSGTNLTTTNGIDLNSASRRFSSLISDGTINGTVNYNRYTNKIGLGISGGNDLVSAPLSGQSFLNFAAANPDLASNPADISAKAFATYNNVTGNYENYDTDSEPGLTADLLDGKGYRAATTDGSPLMFTGTVNTGTINTTIAIGTGSIWNLVGNPFPSYLDAQAFLTANGSVIDETVLDPTYNAIYGYNDSTDGTSGGSIWTIINSLQNPGKNIAPGQGFFVASNDVGGADNLTFAPGMRTMTGTDDFILGRTAQDSAISHLSLMINNSTNTYKTDFYFTDNSSLGLDPGYDAGSFDAAELEFSLYSHLVTENSGIDMAIQALANSDINDVVIPLGINAVQGQQIKVSISESDLTETTLVYLEDNVANTFTLLNTNDYIFTPLDDLTGVGRFFLHYSSTTLSLNDENLSGLQIFTSANPKLLHVNGKLSDSSILDLYDIQGRLVLTKKLDINNNSNVIGIESIGLGVYIVKLKIGGLTKTQKVIIR